MVIVLTDKPRRRAMNSPEVARRMVLWAIELSEFDVQYCHHMAIKWQVIADFITKFMNIEGQGVGEVPPWSIHTDRSSTRQVGRVGVVLCSPKGDEVECMVRFDFPTTNNEAEYEAFIVGLDLAKAAGAVNVVVYCDSQVVTSQVKGNYECKGERMKKYLEQVKNRVNNLQAKFFQIPGEENKHADCFAEATSVEHMLIPNQVHEIESKGDWTMPITYYLMDGVLLDDKEAARKLGVQATRFVLIKDVLYKRGFSRSYLRCLILEEADYVMQEVHEGVYGNHSRSRSLVHKLMRVGYYWLTMQKDAIAYVKACDEC